VVLIVLDRRVHGWLGRSSSLVLLCLIEGESIVRLSVCGGVQEDLFRHERRLLVAPREIGTANSVTLGGLARPAWLSIVAVSTYQGWRPNEASITTTRTSMNEYSNDEPAIIL
jgi:hypothetical protein